MRFLNWDATAEPSEVRRAFARYYDYLDSIRGALSPATFDFARAPWHYDPKDSRAPHDSWLESLQVVEPASGPRNEKRNVLIRVCLLGAYHDGFIELSYADVSRYELIQPRRAMESNVGHGDWLIDEIRLADGSTQAVHEVQFSCGGRWIIEAREVRYDWISAKGTH